MTDLQTETLPARARTGVLAPQPVSRSERAYEHVRSGILRGEIPVGEPLSDVEISRTLGMSKTPVRQALKLLEKEGLLERGPRRQLLVRGYSVEHRQEILEIREALEQIAAREACRVTPADEIDYLRLSLLRQRRAAQAGDEAAFIELDEEFHLTIARGANLPIVFKLLSELRGFVRIMRLGTTRSQGHLFRVLEEHEKIVEALEARDEKAAAKALSDHLHTADYRLDALNNH